MLFRIKDKVKLFSIGLLISLCIEMFAGDNVSLNERIEFLPVLGVESQILLNPGGLCVTEDEFFIIPDQGAGNIKIYEKHGSSLRWMKTIGRKGYATGELVKPAYSFYDKVESQFAVMDFGKKKILIYHKIGINDFKLVKEISCWAGAWDIKLAGTRLFISGYTTDPDKKPYDLYYIDLIDEEKTYLITSHCKYGLKSLQEYEKEYRMKPDIRAIGIKGCFDIHEDNIYYTWEGDLNVRKLNYLSGQIEKSFGNKTTNYVQPMVSKELLKAYKTRDLKRFIEERQKSSYVKNLFTTVNHVLVIYDSGGGRGNWMQLYEFDGRFVKEVSIPGQIENARMWMDKEKQILYTLSTESKAGSNQYFILKYEIF